MEREDSVTESIDTNSLNTDENVKSNSRDGEKEIDRGSELRRIEDAGNWYID